MNGKHPKTNTFKNSESIQPPEVEIRARPYWPRIPDGKYLAVCTRTFWHRGSRASGERIYIYFNILDGPHAGTELRLICRPSRYPTSNFYRSWSIANDSPPRSRNTRLSPKIFKQKVFRILTGTVKPRHRISGPDGKQRPGEFLPEHLWYSKVEAILSLEVTNEPLQSMAAANGAISQTVTRISSKPLHTSQLHRGRVGRRELGDGDWVGVESRGGQSSNNPNPAGGEGNLAASATPVGLANEENAPLRPAKSQVKASEHGKRHLEDAIYRKHLFDLYDNLPPAFDHKRRVDQLVIKGVRQLFMNRERELEGLDENTVLEAATKQVREFTRFENIRDYDKRKKVVVGCVVSAIAEGTLAALKSKSNG